ncbi:MAG TPA: hypothetical protein VEQ58_19565 [Polyangiaceae bacterium]|nr:hypothetical protein [Polyangiaceae bacterium]
MALLSLTATACGGLTHDSQAVAPPSTYAAPSMPEPALAPGSDYRSSEKSAAAPAPAAAARGESGGSADRAYEAAPKDDRPGLGTEWGETRESRVSSAPFQRRDWSTPLSTSSFFYNDESGVRAMLGSGFWERRTDGVSAARGAITIRVVDDGGSTLPTFDGGGRSYVMGHDGARYSIRIENTSGVRFEAVTTVDGLDVIDGQPGSFEKRGYLIAPWSTVEIDGFRRSEDEVAAFRFGKVRDSYAAKRGSDRNVGVIGVAVFEERGASYPWTGRELQRRDSADAFPGRFAPAP